MQLQNSHITRFIDYLDTMHATTKKLRQENITVENYRLYYDNYKEIKTFISHLDTKDTELQELFNRVPSLPKPNSLLIVVNTFICWIHTSTTIFFSWFWGLFLLIAAAPISIPLFVYTQIRIKQIKMKLEVIETTSAKLSFLLRSVANDNNKIITSSQIQ